MRALRTGSIDGGLWGAERGLHVEPYVPVPLATVFQPAQVDLEGDAVPCQGRDGTIVTFMLCGLVLVRIAVSASASPNWWVTISSKGYRAAYRWRRRIAGPYPVLGGWLAQ